MKEKLHLAILIMIVSAGFIVLVPTAFMKYPLAMDVLTFILAVSAVVKWGSK